jgi:hypothetical protein
LPEQQPDGHDVASHTQLPLTHRWPAAQTDPPVPQLQAPATHRSALAPQAEQAPPPPPHWLLDVAVTHVEPLQHPVGHDDESQTHAPDTQRCPDAHAGPAPQRQLPPLHESAVAEQLTQAAPDAPHRAVEGGETQVVPLQQPEGQLVPSQMQTPLEQRWPTPHALPLPHRHCPLLQVSAVTPHETQVVPLTPQAAAWFPATHEVPLQHPAHDGPSQTHVPPLQRCPAPHASPAPHRHCPPLQLSASRVLHVVQAFPLFPQSDSDVPA